jgi:hypothetical protein
MSRVAIISVDGHVRACRDYVEFECLGDYEDGGRSVEGRPLRGASQWDLETNCVCG